MDLLEEDELTIAWLPLPFSLVALDWFLKIVLIPS